MDRNYRVRAKEASMDGTKVVVRAEQPKGASHAKTKEAAGVKKIVVKVKRPTRYIQGK